MNIDFIIGEGGGGGKNKNKNYFTKKNLANYENFRTPRRQRIGQIGEKRENDGKVKIPLMNGR